MRLEQVDQTEGRGIVILAHFLGGLGAQLFRQQARARARTVTAPSNRRRLSTLQFLWMARRAAQARLSGLATSSSSKAHAAGGAGADHRTGQHHLHGG